jgi:hypothetical protein
MGVRITCVPVELVVWSQYSVCPGGACCMGVSIASIQQVLLLLISAVPVNTNVVKTDRLRIVLT